MRGLFRLEKVTNGTFDRKNIVFFSSFFFFYFELPLERNILLKRIQDLSKLSLYSWNNLSETKLREL